MVGLCEDARGRDNEEDATPTEANGVIQRGERDRRIPEHLQRADEVGDSESATGIETAFHSHVVHPRFERAIALLELRMWVQCLGHCQDEEREHERCDDGGNVEAPPPGQRSLDEAPNDGSNMTTCD